VGLTRVTFSAVGDYLLDEVCVPERWKIAQFWTVICVWLCQCHYWDLFILLCFPVPEHVLLSVLTLTCVVCGVIGSVPEFHYANCNHE